MIKLLTNKPGLDSNQLEHKARLLTLTSLSFNYIGRELSYAEVASTLQIESSQVEKWIIDGASVFYMPMKATECILYSNLFWPLMG